MTEHVPAMSVSPRAGDARMRAAWRYWYPLLALVRRDLKKRYATSFGGAAWTLVHPAALVLLYLFVFGVVFESTSTLFILTGLLPYLALADGIQRSSSALREDRALLDRPDFPAEVLPLVRIAAASITEIAGLALLVAAGMFLGLPMSGWLAVLPLLIVIRVAIAYGVACVVSTLSILIGDIAQALSLLLTGWMFLTPVFYRVEDAPAALRPLFAVNPLRHLVDAYRSVILDGTSPGPSMLIAAVCAIAFVAAGVAFFRRTIERAKDLL